jgi:uncharacterized protein YecT (DUF1311 family)
MRLGVKYGKINVLSRNAEKPEIISTGLRGWAVASSFTILSAALSFFAPVTMAAENDTSGETSLAYCWKQASTRVALAPCLENLLRAAEDRLKATQSRVENGAAELDRVTDYRSKNVERTRASDERWRAYRDAECDRQAEAMLPGTGSGDVYLACRITLTNNRVKQLGLP